MVVANAKVFNTKNELFVLLPMTRPNGKIRIKERNSFSEYGTPFPARQRQISLKNYVEWQIGYDMPAKEENKKKTTLSKNVFKNNKGERKYPYELSEIIYYSFKKELIKEIDIQDTYNKIQSIEDSQLFDVLDSMRISRTNPVEKTINGLDFYEMKVSYPLVVHKFGKYDIYAEVMNREKQKAVGVQPMLYVCLPITSLVFETNQIGRTLNAKECAKWVISKDEAKLALELFRIFGMLSSKHRYDICAILKALFEFIK